MLIIFEEPWVKRKADVMEAEKSVFVEGCKNNSITENKANEIFDNIEKFAGYGFNKSHSAAYALIAYQTAYLKTHFPSHFIASVLSSEQDKTDKLEPHVKDCALMGITIKQPNINTSFQTLLLMKRMKLSTVSLHLRTLVRNSLRMYAQSGPMVILLA